MKLTHPYVSSDSFAPEDTSNSSPVQLAAAYRYLAAKRALHKLDEPTSVVGRNVCLWLPHRQSSLAFDLPPLRRRLPFHH